MAVKSGCRPISARTASCINAVGVQKPITRHHVASRSAKASASGIAGETAA